MLIFTYNNSLCAAIEPSPYFDTYSAHRPCCQESTIRVAAIISITLEYKMRVINFITNYVGPGRGTLEVA